MAAVPKLQFWNSNLRFNRKSSFLGRFFESLFQNLPSFGTGSTVNR
jgi:hypothetical protein